MQTKLTKSEIDLVMVMKLENAGDTNFFENDDDCWFGIIDTEFRNTAKKFGIEGRELSGLMSSLAKKEIASSNSSDGEIYYYIRKADMKTILS